VKRFIQGLLCGVALFAVLILTGVPGVMPNVLDRIERAEIARWHSAQVAFYTDIAFLSCASPDDVRTAAQARNWPVQETVPRKDGVTAALTVNVQPRHPGNPDPYEYIRFDDRGCLMR